MTKAEGTIERALQSTITLPNGWSCKIICFDEITEICYYSNGKFIHVTKLGNGYDVLVAEEVLKIRKQKNEEKSPIEQLTFPFLPK